VTPPLRILRRGQKNVTRFPLIPICRGMMLFLVRGMDPKLHERYSRQILFAEIGEEERIDQLRLSSREFSEESQRQPAAI